MNSPSGLLAGIRPDYVRYPAGLGVFSKAQKALNGQGGI